MAHLWAAEAQPDLPPPAQHTIDFEKQVRPIFADHCIKCHGPDKQKGELRLDRKEAALKGGESHAPDIRPGRSSESPLIQFVAGMVPDMKMPQKGEPLAAEQIGILRAWIDQGANWPETSPTNAIHWSLQPVARPTVPGIERRTDRSRNPIDRFVLATLRANKLSPSAEADRRTLIRRLYFDLLGLPPTPGAVRKFQQDKSPMAYEKLVDELLSSPRYGERWARHWLDVVRFAETTGFEVNTPRPNAWPYRDYVIQAFNEDKPFDQFITEQIAGDLFGQDAATGFLVAGPDDKVKSPDPVLTANQRADELHDIVSTTGSAFLGLTVGCARCHNHKFDPIPQTDYYAVRAVFEGVQHGDRKMKSPDSDIKEKELADRRKQLAQIDSHLSEFEPMAQIGVIDTNHLRAAVHPRRNVERFHAIRAARLRFTINKTTDAEPCLDELEVYTAETPPRNIALASLGAKASASSVYPNSEIHRLEHLNDGKYGNSRSWISNERSKGWVELEFPETNVINCVVWSRDREQKFTDRLATDYRIEVSVGSNDWRQIASSADRQKYIPGQKPSPGGEGGLPLAALSPAQVDAAKKLISERAAVEARIVELAQVPTIYGGTFVSRPEPTYRLQRGDPMQKREVVSPGALSLFSIPYTPDHEPGLTKGREMTDDQTRRLRLARWIANPANPLTARVLVNRLWQHHFGEGLVSTPSDFGVNGARPSHPELLDWLAAEFMEPTLRTSGATAAPWSIKHLQRLIVTSAAYRQSSDSRRQDFAIDAGSRLLWRFPPRRLEAEPIRDMILSVSGKLDLRMGGPGFSFFEPNDNYVRVYTPKRDFSPADFRRMVYGTVVRQRPDGVFGVFDCPDGGQIAPKRIQSTTPLQALNLLNSRFMMQQAQFLAERLEQDAGRDAKAQARRAFALAFQREPDSEELRAATKLIGEQGLRLFCRALFNANEFVYQF